MHHGTAIRHCMWFSTGASGDEGAEEHAIESRRVQRGDSDILKSLRDELDDADDFLFVVEERLELRAQELWRHQSP